MKSKLESTIAYAGLTGCGLALLIAGLFPIARGRGEAKLIERNKTLLNLEILGVGALTTFGAYKLLSEVSRQE